MPVERLLREISSKELTEWMAFDMLEPQIGPMRADYRIAQLACLIANVNRDTKRRKRPFEVADFLLKFETEMGRSEEERRAEKEEEDRAVKNYAALMHAMHGGAQGG